MTGGGLYLQSDGVTLELNDGTGLESGGTPLALASATRMASKTADYIITLVDISTHFNNAGAVVPIRFTLPTPRIGLNYGFAVVAAQQLAVVPANNLVEIIRVGELLTTSEGLGQVSSSVPGSYLEIEAADTTTWISRMVIGSWQVRAQKLFAAASLTATGLASL